MVEKQRFRACRNGGQIIMKTDGFVSELIDTLSDPTSRIRVVSLLAKYAGQVVYIPVSKRVNRRVRVAANMLANDVQPAEVVSTLVSRFGICARTAQRDVSAARKMSVNDVAPR